MTSRDGRPDGGGQPRVVTSLQNERVKFIRSLEMRKVRKETGLFVAEGAAILITARDNGFVPRTLIYQAGTAESGVYRGLVAWALKAGAEVLEVSDAVLTKLASKDNPQTMLATFEQRWGEQPVTREGVPGDTWLALEEIRDPGNLGTILRTVDAVGAKGVILVGASCDPYSGEAIRATMGSVFAVPLVRMDRPAFLNLVAAWKGDVIGTHLDGRDDFRAVTYKAPTLIVMGSEGPGLSAELASSCTRLVKIPMAGRLDSLNLAVATALMLYQVRGPHLKL